MQNSIVMFTFPVFNWKYSFWMKMNQKIKIVSLSENLVPRLTCILRINLIVYLVPTLIWICKIQCVVHIFCFRLEIPFLGKFSSKIRIASLSWNLVPRLISICRIQWKCDFFTFRLQMPFWANSIQKSKMSL